MEIENQEKEINNFITIDEFKKVRIKVAKVLEAEEHPNADKLYILKVSLGEENLRQIVAGVRQSYTKEELIGKKILIIENLKPAVLRGVESKGMLLAGKVLDKVIIISPDKDIPEGTILS